MRHTVREKDIIFREFFKIERARVQWEQFDGSMGEEQTRYVVRRGDSVGIIPVCEKTGKIVLIQQFRYAAAGKGTDGYLWEIPAGMIGKDEQPVFTARRELLEEIGFETEEITPLISFFLSPGALDERFYLYIASIPDCATLDRFGGNRHEQEDIRIKAFPLERILRMMKESQIADGKTIASLLYYMILEGEG